MLSLRSFFQSLTGLNSTVDSTPESIDDRKDIADCDLSSDTDDEIPHNQPESTEYYSALVRVCMIIRRDMRVEFGFDKCNRWGFFSDYCLSPMISRYVDLIHYPKGHSTLYGHTSDVFCAVISSNGKHLFTGSADQSIIHWNLTSNAMVFQWKTDYQIMSLSLHRGSTLASCGDSNTIQVWNVNNTHELYQVLKSEEDREWTTQVEFGESSERLIAGYNDGSIRIWSVSRGLCTMALRYHHSSSVTRLIWDHQGWIISGDDNGLVCVSDVLVGSMDEQKSLKLSKKVCALSMNCDQSYLAVVTGASLEIYHWQSSKLFHKVKMGATMTEFHPFDPDLLAIGKCESRLSGSCKVVIYRVSLQKPVMTLDFHYLDISGLYFTPNGSRLISTSLDTRTQVWDVSTTLLS